LAHELCLTYIQLESENLTVDFYFCWRFFCRFISLFFCSGAVKFLLSRSQKLRKFSLHEFYSAKCIELNLIDFRWQRCRFSRFGQKVRWLRAIAVVRE
jgi:hypothetical protein